MKSEQDILSSVLKTTQMGQIGIRSVLDIPMNSTLLEALHDQLAEYDRIESDAHTLATQRGWELPELDPALKGMAGIMSRIKLMGADTDSKIADMMILGNTRGMVKGLRNLHALGQQGGAICGLAQKLLDTENANIRQMQPFL